jgi:hypothetical protein
MPNREVHQYGWKHLHRDELSRVERPSGRACDQAERESLLHGEADVAGQQRFVCMRVSSKRELDLPGLEVHRWGFNGDRINPNWREAMISRLGERCLNIILTHGKREVVAAAKKNLAYRAGMPRGSAGL